MIANQLLSLDPSCGRNSVLHAYFLTGSWTDQLTAAASPELKQPEIANHSLNPLSRFRNTSLSFHGVVFSSRKNFTFLRLYRIPSIRDCQDVCSVFQGQNANQVPFEYEGLLDPSPRHSVLMVPDLEFLHCVGLLFNITVYKHARLC